MQDEWRRKPEHHIFTWLQLIPVLTFSRFMILYTWAYKFPIELIAFFNVHFLKKDYISLGFPDACILFGNRLL